MAFKVGDFVLDRRFLQSKTYEVIGVDQDDYRLKDIVSASEIKLFRDLVDKHYDLIATSTPVTLKPGATWVPPSPVGTKFCTCGVSAVKGTKHSDWCDLAKAS